MMYRVIAIVGGALALAACSSSGSGFLDSLKPAPSMDSVQFESEPPGAEAKVSNGQTCRTPCALALPTEAALTVTFTLNGYQPETESIEVVQNTGSAPALRPNPVSVELTAAPATPAKKPAAKRPAKKPAAKTSAKPAAKKPAAAAPQTAPASAPAPAAAEPPPQQAPSPWPATPAPQR